MAQELENRVYFEAVIPSESGRSLFELDAFVEQGNLQQFRPPAGRGVQAATVLQSLGFRVQHIGTFSISGNAPRELWEKVFGTRVERRSQPLSTTHPEVGEVGYWAHVAGVPFTIPDKLKGLVDHAFSAPTASTSTGRPARVS
jgi:serine protease AprX